MKVPALEPSTSIDSVEEFVDQHYSEAWVQSLATQYDFDPTSTEFRKHLVLAAGNYYYEPIPQHISAEDRERRKEMRKAISAIEKATAHLKKAEMCSRYIFFPEFLQGFGFSTNLTSRLPEELSDIHNCVDVARLTDLCLSYALKQIQVEEELHRGQKGPKIDQELSGFVVAMKMFWTERLERRFTLDYHKGEGLTPAYNFVRDALEPIATVDSATLVTAMRRSIAEARAIKEKVKNRKKL